MKKITMSLLTVTVLGLGFSQAAMAMKGDKSINVGAGIGTAPISGLGTGLGLGAGVGYEILNNTQVRGDFNFFHWNKSSVDFNRYIFSVGARQFLPLQSKLKAYGEASALLSLFRASSGGASSTTTRIGVNPGVGVQYAVTPQISVGAEANYYIVSDSFFAVRGTVGYHF